METHEPFYADVQSHYDLSDDFFSLFLDPTRTYSCGYWKEPGYTLEDAQRAKIDLALGKCDLRPGMTLLDIGCGWGATMLRAIQRHGVHVIGLTLSRNQYVYVSSLLDGLDHGVRAEVRLQGWEEFDEKVDRIVSIGAFEHFKRKRYKAFFDFAHRVLPDDGRMLLHTIVLYGQQPPYEANLSFSPEETKSFFDFAVFMRRNIFPGGNLPLLFPVGQRQCLSDYAKAAGFGLERIQPLQQHYAKTLDHWADSLRARRAEAVEIGGEQTYEIYMKYLTGCADLYRGRRVDVVQFTCTKTPVPGGDAELEAPPPVA